MTGFATLPHGSSRADVLRLFYDHLKAAGTPVLSRAALTAIKAAALAGYARGREEGPLDLSRYDAALRDSWVGDELQRARNVRPG